VLITKPSKKLCYKCNKKRLGYKKKEATGEGMMFEEIWEEREKVSFISGKSLKGYENGKFFYHLFAHVLSKGSHPKFRLNKENIVLLTPEEHNLYDFGSEENREAYAERNKCSWAKLYELKEKLRQEYYEQ
jgi:hypothetical protein